MSLEDVLPGLVQVLDVAFIDFLFHAFQISLLRGRRIEVRLISGLGTLTRVSSLMNLDFPAGPIFTRATQTRRIHGAALGVAGSKHFAPLIMMRPTIRSFSWRILSLRKLPAHEESLLLFNLLLFC